MDWLRMQQKQSSEKSGILLKRSLLAANSNNLTLSNAICYCNNKWKCIHSLTHTCTVPNHCQWLIIFVLHSNQHKNLALCNCFTRNDLFFWSRDKKTESILFRQIAFENLITKLVYSTTSITKTKHRYWQRKKRWRFFRWVRLGWGKKFYFLFHFTQKLSNIENLIII